MIDWLPLYAQDEAGYHNLCALVSAAHLDRPVEEDAACPARRARGPHRRADRADRRRRGRARPAARRGAGRGGGELLDRLAGPVPRPALCRAQPPRRSGRAGGRGGADRARLCPRPAAGRDQSRPLMPRPISTPRTTRCSASPSRARSTATTASRSSPEAWMKPAAEMRALVRRPARGDRQHVGDRAALRVRRAEAQADPAEHRRRHGGRGGAAARRRPRRARGAARRSTRISPRRSARPISTGSNSSST